jgi:hypothetical protein
LDSIKAVDNERPEAAEAANDADIVAFALDSYRGKKLHGQ